MPQAGINDEREDFSGNLTPRQDTVGERVGNEEVLSGDNVSQEDTQISNVQSPTKESPEAELQKAAVNEDLLREVVEQALEDNLLAMNAITIKNKFPKSYNACKDYMIVKSQFPPDEETMIGVLLYTPRNLLYDFFDQKKLFINIHGSDTRWKYSWEANESSDPFTSRVFAEHNGFMEGFERLEKLI